MKISGRHLIVLIAMCGLLASGIGLLTNVGGLFFSPICEEFGIMKGAASMTLTIANVSLAIGGLFVPRLLSERTLKPMLIIATAVLAASTAAMSLCPSIFPMYVLSAIRGFSAGLMTFVFVTTVLNRWFVAGIGLATSIAMGFSGVAGAIFSPVVNGIIEGAGWRFGFVVLGILSLLLNLPAILLLPSLSPETSGLKALGAEETPKGPATQRKNKPSIAAPSIDVTLFAAAIAYALLGSALTALPQHFPGMSENLGLGASVGATMLSVCMIANTVGKVALGALIDRIGTKISVLIYIALISIATVMFLFVKSPAVLTFCAVLYGLCYAIATVGISMLTRDAFGVDNYDRTYPTISLTGNMANACFSSVVGFMYDFSGGYASTLIMFCLMLAATAAIVLFVYARKPRPSLA